MHPVSAICSFSYFMFVPNAVPARSVQEFIAYARENHGKLTMASPGTGSAPHLCGEYFKRTAGIEMAHAPYRGAGPAMGDLIPGRVHLLFSGGATLENARAGQVRVLGYTGTKRAPSGARRADDRGGRPSGLRGRVVVWVVRPGKDSGPTPPGQ